MAISDNRWRCRRRRSIAVQWTSLSAVEIDQKKPLFCFSFLSSASSIVVVAQWERGEGEMREILPRVHYH